jgi:hypothetical protein
VLSLRNIFEQRVPGQQEYRVTFQRGLAD